jgi:hypothetical protein
MLTLYSYPELFGVADNNGYGLKVFAFLRLAGVPFKHEHIFDASAAPRGQLPYIVDDRETVGDSDAIIAHAIRKYRLTTDDGLTASQRDTDLLVRRMLDDLYWVMSYSRWKDERFWPALRDALLREQPEPDRSRLAQGAGIQFPALSLPGHRPLRARRRLRARARGSRGARPSHPGERLRARAKADHHRCRHLRIHRQHLFLRDRHSLKQFVMAHANIVRHCRAIHDAVMGKQA